VKALIKVKFFGKLADQYGEEIVVPNCDGQNVTDLIRRLDVADVYLIAVNGEVCSDDVKLKDGDEVVLMPPVGGG
jgi:molybdopterin converting factor small subunit